jgi:hypothetical protein
MNQSLARSRDYLSVHRRTIIGRSLAAAVAGAIPVPILDDWLTSAVKRSTIRRIADARGVDITEEGVRALADGEETPPRWAELLGSGLMLRLLSRQGKKLFIAVLAAKRAKAAADNFEVATLFDHYCARVHVGLGLNERSARLLREQIDRCRKETEGSLGNHLFRRGLLAAAKHTFRAPVEFADMLSGGRVQKLLTGNSEIEATTEVDELLEEHLKAESSLF